MFWYEDEIKSLERKRDAVSNQSGLVFYGSSSFRLWENLEKEFESFSAVNMGFGGSTLAACSWFFERIMTGMKPTGFIIYAGDNDLGDGRHPEEVFIFYQRLILQIRNLFGNIPIAFVSVKPSLSRWNIIKSIRYTNRIIKADITKRNDEIFFIDVFNEMVDDRGFPLRDIFEPEGLHLNENGYNIWKEVIGTHPFFSRL
jgi:lysophospholipase L1-like esterase